MMKVIGGSRVIKTVSYSNSENFIIICFKRGSLELALRGARCRIIMYFLRFISHSSAGGTANSNPRRNFHSNEFFTKRKRETTVLQNKERKSAICDVFSIHIA